MAFRRVVVDGSNIATEGRSVPSLAQLDEAVREFQREYPDAEVTVVVDASFGHRIDESERMAFDEAEDHGEIVSPPAGAIGRGDAFLLRIAEKTGATVLSNDSFQEFHGEHEWLFSQSRLVGGKPVPGVGWIFTPRTPVRGPRSRVATQDAKRARVRVGSKEASKPMPVPASPPPGRGRRDGRAKEPADGAGAAKESADGAGAAKAGAVKEATPPADPKVRRAIAAATEEVVSPQTSSGGRRRRRGSGPPPQAVNDPLTFIRFIAEHPLGQQLEGEVEGFTSHGAFVRIEDAQAYVPVSGLGDPPPRSARRVLRRGERRPFVLQALDPQRRGVELALPEYAQVAGSPSEETVEAEISEATAVEEVPETRRGAPRKRAQKAKAADEAEAGSGQQAAEKADGRSKRTKAAKAGTIKKAKAAAGKAAAGKKAKTAAAKTAAAKTPAAKTAAKAAAGKTAAGKTAAAKTAAKSGRTAKATKASNAEGPTAAETTKTAKKAAKKASAPATKKAAKKAAKATKDKSAGTTAKAPTTSSTARTSEGQPRT